VKKSNELLIGCFVCFIFAVLYWGVNFLKGENIFSDKRFFYAIYHNVDGLTVSRPVTINGFRVGQVSNISFYSTKKASLIVEVSIEEDIKFSRNSTLEIYDSDIMGSKALELKVSQGDILANSGDTLKGSLSTGITGEMTEQFGSVKVSIDALIMSFDHVLKDVKKLVVNTNSIIIANESKISNTLSGIESIVSMSKNQADSYNNLLSNIEVLSSDLSKVEFVEISDNLLNISKEVDSLLINLNNGNSTLSNLLNEDDIHEDLSRTIVALESLLKDIHENPKKYVNFSVW